MEEEDIEDTESENCKRYDQIIDRTSIIITVLGCLLILGILLLTNWYESQTQILGPEIEQKK